MQLDALLADYVATNPLIRSPETSRLLRVSTKHFQAFTSLGAHASELTDRNLVSYAQWRRNLGRSESTIEREVAKLLTLARYAAALGLLPAPRIRQVKARIETPVAFLRHEVRALFRAARHYQKPIRTVPGNVYMVALLDVIWDCGERVGALCHVTRADIDLRGRWLRITTRKQNGRTLVRRLSRRTVRSLSKLMAAHTSDRVFGVVDRTSLYGPLNEILIAAGLPTDRRHKFHALRRSHASYLHVAGGDARASLDHADEATTRRYYFDPRVVRAADASRLLFNPAGPLDRLWEFLGW